MNAYAHRTIPPTVRPNEAAATPSEPVQAEPAALPNLTVHTDLTDLTDLVLRLDRPGPRYTSYPPADRFSTAFGAADALAALTRADTADRPLSVYVHLPHCHRLCGYCACNVVPTKSMNKRQSYIDLVLKELELASAKIPHRSSLGQLHFGGGTPNSYPIEDLTRLVQAILARFPPTPSAELAMEVDPRYVTDAQMAALAALGLNRISFGVQDFDLDVQRAIGRHQSETQTLRAVELARKNGFKSVNIDLVYGLPRQSLERFSHTLTRLIETRPDRVALFSFAYLPDLKKNQRIISKDDLPDAPTRARMLVLARERMVAAGYHTIGMDHYALPHDSLATAEATGRLRRNFQGYTVAPAAQTDPAAADDISNFEILGLGLSAISDIGSAYIQNHKDIEPYEAAIAAGTLPVERGLASTPDDTARR
ncbi:MAG TPA: oxygen-independent coproporphyrinogen III oxidase, partial [Myxococcota bacterium]|nr:oxygen-independent coproporphyrinogen III oxidase [Myxococcota bacterium]